MAPKPIAAIVLLLGMLASTFVLGQTIVRDSPPRANEAEMQVIRNYVSSGWRLDEISLSRLDSELGFAYHATFRAPERGRGPTCTFTIVDGEIEIHWVGYWIS